MDKFQKYLTKELYLKSPAEALIIDSKKTVEKIEGFILKEVEKARASGLVLGLSGGIDSAIVATLCKNAVGPEKVYALMMPSETNQSSDTSSAVALAEKLGINYKIISISDIEEVFLKKRVFDEFMSRANLKPRIRMALLYGVANSRNYLVTGCGNKSELSVGYFTKFGDGGCDILPIGDLYKTQVYQLARCLEVPERIIQRAPTAGLWKGQTDEDEMGIKYKVLDQVLLGLELGIEKQAIAKKLEINKETVEAVVDKILKSQHKREMPINPETADAAKPENYILEKVSELLENNAIEWLNTHIDSLNKRTPMEVIMEGESGRKRVLDVLIRMEWGIPD
jgi:NAD+ synthase